MKNTLKLFILGGLLTVAMASNASTWTPISPTSSPFAISYTQGNKVKVANIAYTPSPATSIWYYDDNITPQNPTNIGSVTEAQFGLTPGSLSFVSACDRPTSGCTGATGGTTTGTYSNTFTSQFAYNYLAVHFGQGELLFHWASNLLPGTVFEIGGLPRGLSNYRAYTDNPSEVPLPAAAWLFGSALMGFMGFSSRRKL